MKNMVCICLLFFAAFNLKANPDNNPPDPAAPAKASGVVVTTLSARQGPAGIIIHEQDLETGIDAAAGATGASGLLLPGQSGFLEGSSGNPYLDITPAAVAGYRQMPAFPQGMSVAPVDLAERLPAGVAAIAMPTTGQEPGATTVARNEIAKSKKRSVFYNIWAGDFWGVVKNVAEVGGAGCLLGVTIASKFGDENLTFGLGVGGLAIKMVEQFAAKRAQDKSAAVESVAHRSPEPRQS